jgi:exodeoxyribonuclease III
MKSVKIATWNVNSVRHRINLVTRFLREEQPDVLCLQETKVMNELFPKLPIHKLGYEYQAIHGQKAYHGVAILSKIPFRETGVQDFCREGHARHMGVTLANGVEVHNFYVPAGGDIPDPKLNGKFDHKLHFLQAM